MHRTHLAYSKWKLAIELYFKGATETDLRRNLGIPIRTARTLERRLKQAVIEKDLVLLGDRLFIRRDAAKYPAKPKPMARLLRPSQSHPGVLEEVRNRR